MIDFENEELLTLAQASKKVPGRTGSHVNTSTLWRWALRGLRGVRLETLAIGGTTFTSTRALQQFFERSKAAAQGLNYPVTTPAIRRKAMEAAEAELAKDGI
jgi:hypothetical protein